VLPREVHEHTYKVNAIQNFMFQVLGEVPIPGNEPVEKIRMEVQVKVKNAEKCPGVKRGASVMVRTRTLSTVQGHTPLSACSMALCLLLPLTSLSPLPLAVSQSISDHFQ
jgi:hypothetical protein